MITITRSFARQLHKVLKAVFGNRTYPALHVHFDASSTGLQAWAATFEGAVLYSDSGSCETDSLTLPFEALAEMEGSGSSPITLTKNSKSVTASWEDSQVPLNKSYFLEKPSKNSFPALPTEFKEQPPEFLDALSAAKQCISTTSARYALSALCLNDKGAIITTDGHQLLLQSGFDFGWAGEALVPCSKVFQCKELAGSPVYVGKTDKHFALNTGKWTVVLTQVEGRFPRTHDIIANCSTAKSVLELHPSDAEFLSACLSKLPCPDFDDEKPVTLDLNGQIVIRARAEEKSTPTELVLSNSAKTGEDLCLSTNRRFLQRALDLGFRKFHCFASESPVTCQDERRTYLWMLLNKDGIIPVNANSTRIESPVQGAANPTVSISNSIPSRRTALFERT